jgi:SAM-dependent methyltransferase
MGVGVKPLSYLWGGDRGVPIFAFFIDEFLRESAGDLRGYCLEFYNDQYKPVAWEHRLDHFDHLHIGDPNHLELVAGMSKGTMNLPSDSYDCIICTHTLHCIADVRKAVAGLYRILKPGGVLLVAVPLVSMYEPGLKEYWRFTEMGLESLLAEVFGAANVLVRSYGNSVTAAGQLRGLTVDEYTRAELNTHDPRFAVEVCGRAVKAG